MAFENMLPQASPETQVQLLVPVYNEGENVLTLYHSLIAANVNYDSLKFVYDFEGDSTLPYIEELRARDSRVHAEKNEFGRGVINALRWGFSRASDGPVVVIMGDNSDKLDIIPQMLELWRGGAVVVSPSRYMKGGEQHGGGVLKKNLSRFAGLSLKLLGLSTADPTNNFKLYDGSWLRRQHIESIGGFEVALELVCKAYEQRQTIAELPTVWRDRTLGESRFRLWKWLPKYLRWYFRLLKAIVLRQVPA